MEKFFNYVAIANAKRCYFWFYTMCYSSKHYIATIEKKTQLWTPWIDACHAPPTTFHEILINSPPLLFFSSSELNWNSIPGFKSIISNGFLNKLGFLEDLAKNTKVLLTYLNSIQRRFKLKWVSRTVAQANNHIPKI